MLELMDGDQESERDHRQRDAEQRHHEQQHEVAAIVQPRRGGGVDPFLLGILRLATHAGRLLDRHAHQRAREQPHDRHE
jgi:hypothetical protein